MLSIFIIELWKLHDLSLLKHKDNEKNRNFTAIINSIEELRNEFLFFYIDILWW